MFAIAPLRSGMSQRSWSGRHSPSTSERWPCYRPCQKSLPWCACNTSPGIGTVPATDQPRSRDGVVGACDMGGS